VAIEQVKGAPAAAGALFDVIVLTGSVAKAPQELLNLLKPAGRMIAIIGDEPMMYGTLVTRQGNGAFTFVQKWDTVAARLPGFAEPSSFSF
jgi:protein-L-isoaspartate(D-aspartate) O-methyltransferase